MVSVLVYARINKKNNTTNLLFKKIKMKNTAPKNLSKKILYSTITAERLTGPREHEEFIGGRFDATMRVRDITALSKTLPPEQMLIGYASPIEEIGDGIYRVFTAETTILDGIAYSSTMELTSKEAGQEKYTYNDAILHPDALLSFVQLAAIPKTPQKIPTPVHNYNRAGLMDMIHTQLTSTEEINYSANVLYGTLGRDTIVRPGFEHKYANPISETKADTLFCLSGPSAKHIPAGGTYSAKEGAEQVMVCFTDNQLAKDKNNMLIMPLDQDLTGAICHVHTISQKLVNFVEKQIAEGLDPSTAEGNTAINEQWKTSKESNDTSKLGHVIHVGESSITSGIFCHVSGFEKYIPTYLQKEQKEISHNL